MSTKISTTLAENEKLKAEMRRLEEELKGKDIQSNSVLLQSQLVHAVKLQNLTHVQ